MTNSTPPEPFTDGEMAFLRHARFGSLPAPVRADDRVELAETDPKRDWPHEVMSRAQTEALQSGG